MPYSPYNRAGGITEEGLRQIFTDQSRYQFIQRYAPKAGGECREYIVKLGDVPHSELPALPDGDGYDQLGVAIERNADVDEWNVTLEPIFQSAYLDLSISGSIGPTGKLKDVSVLRDTDIKAGGDIVEGEGTLFSAPEARDSADCFTAEVLEANDAFVGFDSLLNLFSVGKVESKAGGRIP